MPMTLGAVSRIAPFVAGVALLSCRSNDRERSAESPISKGPAAISPTGAGASPPELMSEGPAPSASDNPSRTFPPPWCERAGPESTRIDVINAIANDYFVETTSTCSTAGLTISFTLVQRMSWLGYLIDFTFLLTGCPLDLIDEQPVIGGLSEFGIANTSVVGVERGLLGPDDVESLISMYVRHFGDALQLTPEDRTTLYEFLADTAEDEIDPESSLTLSTCPDGEPASP